VRVLLLALVLMASPVAAQQLIDYELLFAQNADRVVTTTDVEGGVHRTLRMPGEVTLTCSSDGCHGWDMGAEGPVGCIWDLAMALRAVAEVCAFPSDTQEGLAVVHGRLSAFVAENAVPPRPVTDLEAFYLDQVAAYRDGDAHEEALDCDSVSRQESDVGIMIAAMIAALLAQPSPLAKFEEADTFDLDALLATPRLPVMQPCGY